MFEKPNRNLKAVVEDEKLTLACAEVNTNISDGILTK